MDDFVIRKMEPADIVAVSELEKLCFSMPWSAEALAKELGNALSYYLVAVSNGKVIGYAGAWHIVDEAHITNVAVAPDYRQRAVGERLMAAMIARMKDQGAVSMTLEVRRSNSAALRLYGKLNFKLEGVRKNYYEAPVEDALILWLKGI